ncbi:MAG: hypothetical protein JST16_02890 [Bdellovibrionales bacterium]|nr:hypothetical protein [Bdellovibrionales bacterium]
MDKIAFARKIVAVKARIRLIRSFDQIPTHQYQGYVLVLDTPSESTPETGLGLRIAVGTKAHEKYRFRIGDVLSGEGEKIPDLETEWADFYKVSGIEISRRGPESEERAPDPDGGIAPPLERYRVNGHFRLEKKTCEAACARCPWGLTMPTQIILDHWNPSKVKWRFETHCYGPRGCPRYKAGKPYRVPGRKAGMFYIDDDVERFEGDEG